MWMLFVSSRKARELWSTYLKILALFLFICHHLILGVKSEHVNGKGKGEDCSSRSDLCNKYLFLECIGNSCECKQADGLTWVPEQYSCMIMEGATCGSGTGNIQPKCVPNSSCFDGKCECNDDFLRNGFGRCELSYGGVCSVGNKCAVRYLLECQYSPHNQQEGICRCRGEGDEYVWDDQKRKCVSTANGACDTPKDPGYGKDDQLECIENAECVDSGYCRCKPGFAQTSEGTCLLEYGQKCNNSNGYNCNHHDHLICQDGRCACQFYGQMIYDNDTKQCLWLVDETCDISDDEQLDIALKPAAGFPYYRRCVKDAYCKQRPGSYKGVCECVTGFETASDRTCTKDKSHGHPCSASLDCDRKRFLECIIDDGNDGRCGCVENEMYFDGKQCRVLPGKSCADNHLCSHNSYCEGHWCICAQGYQISKPDCIKTSEHENTERSNDNEFERYFPSRQNQFGGGSAETVSLSPEDRCKEETSESMELERCKCRYQPGSHTWSKEKGACVALVGSDCKNDEDCTDDALCDSEDKTCQCFPTAHTTSNRTCLRRSTHSAHEHHLHDHTDYTEKMHTLKSVTVDDLGDYQYLSGATVQFLSNHVFGCRFPSEILLAFTGQYCLLKLLFI